MSSGCSASFVIGNVDLVVAALTRFAIRMAVALRRSRRALAFGDVRHLVEAQPLVLVRA
jgi:hypothetical protein